jgi:hypothetical protein
MDFAPAFENYNVGPDMDSQRQLVEASGGIVRDRNVACLIDLSVPEVDSVIRIIGSASEQIQPTGRGCAT